MIPEMIRKNYNREYSVALTTAAATTGLVIPPSNIMIVFAVVAGNVSVAAMFLAGVLPGLTIGLAIALTCTVLNRYAAPEGEASATQRNASWAAIRQATLGALPSLGLVILVLAGILGGAFSATEAAAIAVLYAFVLAVLIYREVKWTELPSILLRTGITTSIIFMLIGTSQAMSWVLAYENIPQSISQALLGLSENRVVILLMMNLLLLCVGTFMDMTPAVLIFTPIFLPVATGLGMDPVHFGIMLIANLCIGLCTPPVGTCLFVGCSVGQTSIARVTRPMIPFFFAMLLAVMLITYCPPLSLWLPRLLGL